MAIITMKSLLESGVHFGHQTHKWNPKMKKYIFIKRNGIHILDLKQTLDAVHEAYMFIKDIVSKGESILFVGTKKQAKESVENSAKKCGAFFVSNRWYGGMLTNMRTIRQSIEKMDYYEQIVEDGTINSFTKLEATKMRKVYDKIDSALGGIRGMDKLPGAIFVVDTIKEKIAVHEARKLNIPIVAMVDTNCDPDIIDYVIPANDDAIRAILLIANTLANAVIEGKQAYMEGADIVSPEIEEKTTQKKPEKIHKEKLKKKEPEKAKPEKVESKKEIKKEKVEIEKPKKESKPKVVEKKPEKEKPQKESKPKVIEKKPEIEKPEKESKPKAVEKKPDIEKPEKELKPKVIEKKPEIEKPKKESKPKAIEKKPDKEPEKIEEKQKEEIAKPKKKNATDEKPKKEKEISPKKTTKKTTAKKSTSKKEKQEEI